MLRLALFAGLGVMAAGAVADIPRTPGGNESELRQKVTIELPEQDASANDTIKKCVIVLMLL